MPTQDEVKEFLKTRIDNDIIRDLYQRIQIALDVTMADTSSNDFQIAHRLDMVFTDFAKELRASEL